MTRYGDDWQGEGRGGRSGRGGHGHGWGHSEPGDRGRGGPGAGGPWGGGPWGGGRRMRRGDIRVVLLAALVDGAAHGYELIRRLEERSGGMWRPSAGSVYPTLQLLEEEGKLTGRDEGGKRVYELTEEGRAEASAGRDQPPWSGEGSDGGHRELRGAVGQLGLAARQVSMAGDQSQIEAATAVVVEARQRIYRLLAGD
jgi:DNA-binding PadR family transcriptional regulator